MWKDDKNPTVSGRKGFGRVVCTQPPRVAAMYVSAPVFLEMGVYVGCGVGYSIRFKDYSSEETEIKFVVDGMLLHEFLLQLNRLRYKCVMINKLH